MAKLRRKDRRVSDKNSFRLKAVCPSYNNREAHLPINGILLLKNPMVKYVDGYQSSFPSAMVFVLLLRYLIRLEIVLMASL